MRSRGRTRPGTLLKHQIPIRTFADWNEQRPGFAELDLVAHDGGIGFGDYAQTLDMTDVCTGWTETIAVPNKAQVWVFEAIDNDVPAPIITLSLLERIRSRDKDSFSDKLLSAMRNEFGGHPMVKE